MQTTEVDVKRITLCRQNLQWSYFPTGPVSTYLYNLFKDYLETCYEIYCTVHLPSVSEFPSQTTSLVMGLIYVSRSFGGGRGGVTTGYRKGGERENDHCFCSPLFLRVDFCDCTELWAHDSHPGWYKHIRAMRFPIQVYHMLICFTHPDCKDRV